MGSYPSSPQTKPKPSNPKANLTKPNKPSKHKGWLFTFLLCTMNIIETSLELGKEKAKNLFILSNQGLN
jgi:hypothetical protein